MTESFKNKSCINHYQIVTRSWLKHMHELIPSQFKEDEVRYCENSDGNEPYPEFVLSRRRCHEFCDRDCLEESYNLVTDTSAQASFEDPESMASVNESAIIIWPDRKMYEIVVHHREIDFFELIGTLGGHAHIWLGISAIQLYDVFYKVVQNVKFLWQKFVYCS